MKLGNGLISKRYSLLLFNWLHIPASFVVHMNLVLYSDKSNNPSISVLVCFKGTSLSIFGNSQIPAFCIGCLRPHDSKGILVHYKYLQFKSTRFLFFRCLVKLRYFKLGQGAQHLIEC